MTTNVGEHFAAASLAEDWNGVTAVLRATAADP
jgi:hypothetical protein